MPISPPSVKIGRLLFVEKVDPQMRGCRKSMRLHRGAWLSVLALLCLSGGAWGQASHLSQAPLVPEGFQAEVLRLAGDGEGSWISMTFDDAGRIIIGRDDKGLMRLTVPAEDGEVTAEALSTGDVEMRHCRGVLFAHNSLYVTATDSNAFYRMRDMDGDGSFELIEKLSDLDYRSRYGHGANQIALGPDGKIYLVIGNDVSFPPKMAKDSPYRNPKTDWLIANPHDTGEDSRVGYITRMDPEGKNWEVLAGGLRNQVDIAFNREGEMFTYDADMEWDVGLPWYRPTRVNHVVSAGELGWRWGTGKWPTHYEDSLPSTLDTALGSPTSVCFGYESNFPEKYREALLLGDWQNGRVLAAHLKPRGASYEADYDVFIQGAPLNICDMAFGKDGAFYFITGGRGSQSALYRVRYVGGETVESPAAEAVDVALEERLKKEAEAARAIRHQLEAFHRKEDPVAVEAAWRYLGDDDRWLRFAARLAIEKQPVATWHERALREKQPLASSVALLALARSSDGTDRAAAHAALAALPLEEMDRATQLVALRAMEVWFSRHGLPEGEARARLVERIGPMLPTTDPRVNLMVAELQLALQVPGAVVTVMDLLEDAPTQEEQIGYARLLVYGQAPWEEGTRRAMLRWMAKSRRMTGGRLVATVLTQMRNDFVAAIGESERGKFASEIAALEAPIEAETVGSTRPVVKQWTLEDFTADFTTPLQGRDWKSAQIAIREASCLKCHRAGGQGAAIGPDLSHVGGRFDERTMLESILNPSLAIDPKYQNMTYLMDSGQVIVGRPTAVSAKTIVVETDPLAQTTETVDRAKLEEVHPASLSPMPTGLIDVLTRDEVLDLLAWLKAGGNANHPSFQPAAK